MESASVSRNQVGARQWQRPLADCVKCNLNASWRNASLHNSGAWIARNHCGDVLFHARDAFTCSPNRTLAELRCVLWTLQSLHDLRLMDVVIGLDCHAAFQVLHKPTNWPRYRFLLDQISQLRACFDVCAFELETQGANSIACVISTSVSRDGRFSSYLASGGPSWLHDLHRS